MDDLRTTIVDESRRLGATLVGFAASARWDEIDEVPAAYRPAAIWPHARTVIVLGVPLPLPVVESTPSINYQELYNTTNALLDQMAYRLSLFLNDRGAASIPMPRDGYANLSVLLRKMPACFSHVYAGRYAGLGTIGYSHNLINPSFGPRARYVSVFTEAEIASDPMLAKELCKKCALCGRLCPVAALVRRDDRLIADFDAIACTKHHQQLQADGCWPCGVCIKVCPIGADRRLYHRTHIREYLTEHDHPDDPRFAHLTHLRTHGSHRE